MDLEFSFGLGCVMSGFCTSWLSCLDFQAERKCSLTAATGRANFISVKAQGTISLLEKLHRLLDK